MTIDPLHPDADLAWLASLRGVDRGITDIYAARIQARLDAAEWAVAATRQRAAHADTVIAAVQHALDATPDTPGALPRVVAEIAALLQLTARPGAGACGLGQAPGQRRVS